MERRVTSHTEEEEMNQRRRLLMLARKGDQKAVELLFELYQVRVFSGEALKKKKLPTFPVPNSTGASGRGSNKSGKKTEKVPRIATESSPKPAGASHGSQKKTGMVTRVREKTKGATASSEKRKKGRPPSSEKAPSKTTEIKKSAPASKAKSKKSTLPARPGRVKKK